jgi:hypothetical protein
VREERRAEERWIQTKRGREREWCVCGGASMEEKFGGEI